ncbi:hypothetical protein Vadar_017397 [Vaccinium darrowii]|uniref:Uncharacterized protein n=1 Tax=Vaccinium darrowii TaxID=229202 RepID=A0ACB7X1W7_9ERIC|nr:hypothetical protein Vadar_017397 [Vaccinium darrowii]
MATSKSQNHTSSSSSSGKYYPMLPQGPSSSCIIVGSKRKYMNEDPGARSNNSSSSSKPELNVTPEKVKGWSAALKEVASMAGVVSGKESNGTLRYEAELIKEIVGVLKSKLSRKHQSVDNHLQITWSSTSLGELWVRGCNALEKITFETGFCEIERINHDYCPNLKYIESEFKISPVREVDVELLNSIGFFNLDSMADVEAKLVNHWWGISDDDAVPIPIQSSGTKTTGVLYFYGIPEKGGHMVWLSHLFQANLFTEGDEVEVLFEITRGGQIKECGVHLLYFKEEGQVLQYVRTMQRSWDLNVSI